MYKCYNNILHFKSVMYADTRPIALKKKTTKKKKNMLVRMLISVVAGETDVEYECVNALDRR